MLFVKKKKLRQRAYSSKQRKFGQKSASFSWLARIFVLGLIIASFATTAWKSDWLKINRVECQFQNSEVCQAIQAKTLSRPLFNLNADGIEKEIKEKFPQIKKIVFIKKFPRTVKAEILGRKPIAVVVKQIIKQTTEGETVSANYFLVDGEGVLFKQIQTAPQDLFLLEIKEDFFSQNNIQTGIVIPQAKSIMQLLSFLRNNQKIKIKKITAAQKEIILLIGNNLEVLLPLNEEILVEMKKLKMILSYYQDKGVDLKKVDLRFDKPVVIY